jgi:hypothetical protein
MEKIKNHPLHSRSSTRHFHEGGDPLEKSGKQEQIPAYAVMTVKWAGMMVLIVGVIIIMSCSGPSHKEHGPLAQIENHSNNNIEYSVSSDPYTYDVEKVAVTNSVNDTLFFTPNRVNHLVSYPCNKCHTKELSNMVSKDSFGKKAHWDVKLAHATEEALTCVTCHYSSDVEYLRLNNNKKISYNKSQKVCAQCHSTQAKDWVGGAHGKKLGGWAPPRVSNTCVNCHDPHSPAFESRWPSRLNTVKIQELDPK